MMQRWSFMNYPLNQTPIFRSYSYFFLPELFYTFILYFSIIIVLYFYY